MKYDISLRISCILLINVLLLSGAAQSKKMTDYSGIVFPSDHALNTAIDLLPVHPNSANLIATIGANTSLHPDFGTSWSDAGTDYQMGIPYNVVSGNQPKVSIDFIWYGDESDPGPWPIPTDPFIETVFDWRDDADGDRHMLIVDSSTHTLYEAANVYGKNNGTSWEAGCGAVFDLNGYALRPDTWTSADAAGLPIFPLLIRYDEVERALAQNSEIKHAIRFTVQQSQKAYIWPARHYAASSTDVNRAPMGLRFRLKKDFDISGYSPRMQVILRTMKKYGLIVADNGSNWYFQGTHDERWDDEEISTLKQLRGRDFEAVDISPWMNRAGFDINSARVPAATGATQKQLLTGKTHQMRLSAKYLVSSELIEAKITLERESYISMSLIDVSGKKAGEVYTGTVRKGTSVLYARVQDLRACGVYFVYLTSNNELDSKCVVSFFAAK